MKKIIVGALLLLGIALTAEARGYTYVGGDYYNIRQLTEVENTYVSADLTKERVTSSALASVELNPDHKGFSVGLGMYGTTIAGKDVGFNVKAVTAEGGYHTGSVGITVGF